MASSRDAFETDGHDSNEAEALLYDERLSTPDHGLSTSMASMGARNQTPRSSRKLVANILDGGSELARESSPDRQDLDSANLRAQGHEAALQRSFSLLAALGFGFRYTVALLSKFLMTDSLCASITNSWAGYLSNFGRNLIYGGPQSVVFGLLVATAVQSIITLGLSEVASAFPSAGVSSCLHG